MVTKDFADFPPNDVTLKVQIVARASRGRNRQVLFSQEIENPELNEPIRLQIPSGLDVPYLTPLEVTMQVIRGDASTLSDGILTAHFKPRKTQA